MSALAPRLAAPMAMAAPSPVPPPVTRITLPSKSAIRASEKSVAAQFAPGVAHDLGMIEGEVQPRPVLHPLRRCGVVAGFGRRSPYPSEIGDRACVAARIPIRSGVDA